MNSSLGFHPPKARWVLDPIHRFCGGRRQARPGHPHSSFPAKIAQRQKFLILSTLLLFFLSAPWAWATGGSSATLADLDAVLAEAPSLEVFLADERLQRKYFAVLGSYLGLEQKHKASYQAILKQLRKLSAETPELGRRLWAQTSGSGASFAITGAVPNTGRELNATAWGSLELNWRNRLEGKAGNLGDLTPAELADFLRQVRERVKSSVEALHQSDEYKRAARAARESLDRDLFRALRAESDLQKMAAYYAWTILNTEQVQDHLQSGNADLVIATIRRLRADPRAFLPERLAIPEGALLSEIRALLPDANELLEGESIFPRAKFSSSRGKAVDIGGGSTKFEFRPLPRRFHGIWRGIPLGECVGGRCDALSELTPERWATVALQDSQLQFVEKNGSYVGFIEVVPGRVGPKTYGNIGFGAPDLARTITTKDEQGKIIHESLFEAWLQEAKKRMPAAWTGFVVSQSDDINNAHVLETVRASAPYANGFPLEGQNFSLRDKLAKKIVAFSARIGPTKHKLIEKYGGNMILDATTPDGARRPLRALDLSGRPPDLSTLARLEAFLRAYPSAFPSRVIYAQKASPPEVFRAWLETLTVKDQLLLYGLLTKQKAKLKEVSWKFSRQEAEDWERIKPLFGGFSFRRSEIEPTVIARMDPEVFLSTWRDAIESGKRMDDIAVAHLDTLLPHLRSIGQHEKALVETAELSQDFDVAQTIAEVLMRTGEGKPHPKKFWDWLLRLKQDAYREYRKRNFRPADLKDMRERGYWFPGEVDAFLRRNRSYFPASLYPKLGLSKAQDCAWNFSLLLPTRKK
jgi:hypothetical protein